MISLLLTVLAVTVPPAPPDRIYDEAGMLSSSDHAELNTLFNQVASYNHVNLGFISLNNLDDDPKAVAVRTVNYWQMSPSSVLVLVSINPRKIYIQPGDKLAYRFNESTSKSILANYVVPALRSGRYGAAVINGFHGIANVLPGPMPIPPPNNYVAPQPVTTIVSSPVPEESHSVRNFFLITGGLFLIALIAYWIYRSMKKDVSDWQVAPRPPMGGSALRPRPPTYAAMPMPSSGRIIYSNTNAAPVVVAPRQTNANDVLETAIVADTVEHVLDQNNYTPPIHHRPAPVYEPPTYSSNNDSSSSWGSSDSSSGSGGGGFDFGSSFDSGSSGGGGGGSDW